MGSVSIRFSQSFKPAAGVFLHNIADPVSLFDLMRTWCGNNAPEVFAKLFEPKTEYIAGAMLITLNGRSVKSDNPKTTMISPGDVIYVTPILVGG
jgi:hypothetical protein